MENTLPYLSSIEVLLACLHEVKLWLSHNFLTLKENKTEAELFGPSDFYDLGDLDLGDLSSNVSPFGEKLGMIFDSGLKSGPQTDQFCC